MNKFLLPEKSKLLQARLERLSNSLSNNFSTKEFQTQEQLVNEFTRIFRTFSRDLEEPLFLPKPVTMDEVPDSDLYNLFFSNILDDLVILFTEFENVEDISLAHFNHIATESNRLYARLKQVYSKLGDFILYSKQPTTDIFYLKDSFNDLSRVAVSSKLLNKEECFVNTEEGIVTLPINKDKSVPIQITETPIINSSSNGIPGNNLELNASMHATLTDVLDGNADTWFEYEYVVEGETDLAEPLTLDITLNLGAEKVVNYIRINPFNFGTKSAVKIAKLETSLTGQEYISVKDDIPVTGFTTKDEENIFLLAASTSKYAGQGIYTFTPRKIKYIHVVFEQQEPYWISTVDGDMLRYAIGLRDIEVRGIVYQGSGEIISNGYQLYDEISKVMLETNQNPNRYSDLVGIDYFVSTDNGQSWHPIQQKDFIGQSGKKSSIPEILNFNTVDGNAIQTASPVSNLILKASMQRNDDAFNSSSSTIYQKTVSKSELCSTSENNPSVLTLSATPVVDIAHSIQVIDPYCGSCGFEESRYVLGNGRSSYILPFDKLPSILEKVSSGGILYNRYVSSADWIHVFVDGEEWTQTDVPLDDYAIPGEEHHTGTSQGTPPVNYHLYNLTINEFGKYVVEFGNDNNTANPGPDAKISIYFDKERLYPGADKIADLNFTTLKNKDSVIIERYDEVTPKSESIPQNVTIIKLEKQKIIDSTLIASTLNSLGYDLVPKSSKNYVTSSTKWSIDTDRGEIYLGSPTPQFSPTAAIPTLNYTYRDVIRLSNDDWDWVESDPTVDKIKINDSGWKTTAVRGQDLSILGNRNADHLPVTNIIKEQLFLSIDYGDNGYASWTNPFEQEVPFVKGDPNFGLKARYLPLSQKLPSIVSVGGFSHTIDITKPRPPPDFYNPAEVTLSQNLPDELAGPSLDFSPLTVSPVIFTNTDIFKVFRYDRGLTNVGDYYFIRRNGKDTIVVKIDTSSGTASGSQVVTISSVTSGSISYSKKNPAYVDNGSYSIDYKQGIIYIDREIPEGLTVKVSYQTIEYYISYKIARLLSSNSYSVDAVNKLITVKDNETLSRNNLPNENKSNYLVNYSAVETTREAISELKDYFSPVLKDYILKLILKGKMI